MPGEQRKDSWIAVFQIFDSAPSRCPSSWACRRQAHHFAARCGHINRLNYLLDERKWLLFIPQHLRAVICPLLHSELHCNHTRVCRLRLRYYWRGMYRFAPAPHTLMFRDAKAVRSILCTSPLRYAAITLP